MAKCSCFHALSVDRKEPIGTLYVRCRCLCRSGARLHAEEKGRKFEATGVTYDQVEKIKIDSGVIHDGFKCDFLFLHKDINAVFVECKGGDIKHASEQLCTTISRLKEAKLLCVHTKINAAIVSSRVPRYNSVAAEMKESFTKRFKGLLRIKNGKMTYNLIDNSIK